jgi:hypothetical protein
MDSTKVFLPNFGSYVMDCDNTKSGRRYSKRKPQKSWIRYRMTPNRAKVVVIKSNARQVVIENPVNHNYGNPDLLACSVAHGRAGVFDSYDALKMKASGNRTFRVAC